MKIVRLSASLFVEDDVTMKEDELETRLNKYKQKKVQLLIIVHCVMNTHVHVILFYFTIQYYCCFILHVYSSDCCVQYSVKD